MIALPEQLPGHWTSASGHDMAQEYAAKAREDLGMRDCSDFALANELFLADGSIGIQTAAKERMRWLSVQLAIAHQALRRLQMGAAAALATPGLQDGEVADFLAAIHREAVSGLIVHREPMNEGDRP